MFGRYRSRRTVSPDGTITTTITELPRGEWPVLIHDHHPGYISWEQYLANERRLAANDTRGGQRPAREGAALCQGIVRCGACGRSMSTRYQREGGYYECTHSRADHNATPGCRSVKTTVVDELVAGRVLAALEPREIKLALAAADEVADRRARSTRAVELRVERARYEAIRAERAFHACEPENRWSPAASRRAGSRSYASSPKPRPNSPSRTSRGPSPRASSSRRSPATSRSCGPHRQPPSAIASGCCAR